MDGAYADFHKITRAQILNPFLKGPLNPFFKDDFDHQSFFRS